MNAMGGIAVVAAAATLGDFIWYTVGVSHTITAGILHGALLLATVGGAIGATSGRTLKGLPIGAIAGVGGALSYYLLILVLDPRPYGLAIPGAWVTMWLLLAALEGRWLRGAARRPWGEIALRGSIAAVAGGIAFVLVRNTLWGPPPPGGRSYFVQFAAWALAWAPGLFALTWGTSSAASAARSIAALDLLSRINRGETLHILDVRSQREFASGHVPGAVNVPFNRILSRMDRVPRAAGQELFIYCGHGPRACIAALALRRRGYARIVYLRGHFAGWRAAGLRVEQ
jgi:rhodanese-related sulfurtransferase